MHSIVAYPAAAHCLPLRVRVLPRVARRRGGGPVVVAAAALRRLHAGAPRLGRLHQLAAGTPERRERFKRAFTQSVIQTVVCYQNGVYTNSLRVRQSAESDSIRTCLQDYCLFLYCYLRTVSAPTYLWVPLSAEILTGCMSSQTIIHISSPLPPRMGDVTLSS